MKNPNFIDAAISNFFSRPWGYRPEPAETYWLGATREQVISIQGSPRDTGSNLRGLYNRGFEVWNYEPFATLFFQDGKLVAFDNHLRRLHIHSGVRIRQAYFSVGATAQELLETQGTPAQVEIFNFGGKDRITWGFNERSGFSSNNSFQDLDTVTFNNAGAVEKLSNARGILKYRHRVAA